MAAEGPHRAAVMERPLTPEELFARLDALGIAHRTYCHPPVFTVAEATALRGSLPGGHCKSLFLKDKKGGFWLAVTPKSGRCLASCSAYADNSETAAQISAHSPSESSSSTQTGGQKGEGARLRTWGSPMDHAASPDPTTTEKSRPTTEEKRGGATAAPLTWRSA